MPTLGELQGDFFRYLADATPPERLLDIVGAGPFLPAKRLSVYRNNVFITLETALAAVFPVVRRLVDPRFFSFATDSFIRGHFPTERCLSDYGPAFPEFLQEFPPASDVAYLADVARLEWAIHRINTAAPMMPLPLSVVERISEDVAGGRFSVHPGAAYLRSCYPIDMIWQANQPDREPDNVALEVGDFYFEVRGGQGLSIRRMPHSVWAFRSALAGGLTLGQATMAALEVSDHFDLSAEIIGIFADALIVGLELGV
jgi:Putative DNA-binding domain